VGAVLAAAEVAAGVMVRPPAAGVRGSLEVARYLLLLLPLLLLLVLVLWEGCGVVPPLLLLVVVLLLLRGLAGGEGGQLQAGGLLPAAAGAGPSERPLPCSHLRTMQQ
jgi:hypothetical protein